jgi:hypothetical protein
MTLADLLELVDDPLFLLPRHTTIRVCTADGGTVWDVEGALGRAGGPDPEIVLELKETSR